MRWLRTLFNDARPYVTQAEAVTQLKAVMADSPKLNVIYPEADRSKVGDHDILGLVLTREKAQQQQPRNVRVFVGRVKA